MERAGEAEAADLGAASFLTGAAFLATTFLAGDDFLAGEAIVLTDDLLGVRGVCPALLFLATVPIFPPLLPLSVAKEFNLLFS